MWLRPAADKGLFDFICAAEGLSTHVSSSTRVQNEALLLSFYGMEGQIVTKPAVNYWRIFVSGMYFAFYLARVGIGNNNSIE